MIRNKSFGDIDVSKAAAALGRKGGAAKSQAKARTAAENGKLGGRPVDPSIMKRMTLRLDDGRELEFANQYNYVFIRQADGSWKQREEWQAFKNWRSFFNHLRTDLHEPSASIVSTYGWGPTAPRPMV